MELKNENRELKIVFKKVCNRLEVIIDKDFDTQFPAYEVYENIDFEAFIKNIENIKNSKED